MSDPVRAFPIGTLQSEQAMTPEERKESAAEFSGALAPEPLPPLSLYKIDTELRELLEEREDVEAQGALPEEMKVIEDRINQYALAEVKKVDGIATAVRACNAFAEECEREAARLNTMAKRHRSRLERIKASALWAMQNMRATCQQCKGSKVVEAGPKQIGIGGYVPCERCKGEGTIAAPIRRLDTPTNKLRVQANGGVEPLEVYDLGEVPRELKQVTVTLPMSMWHEFQIAVAKKEIVYPGGVVPIGKVDVQQDAIRAELKKRVPCPACPPMIKGDLDDGTPCPRCEGTGTVPASVPGARLLPRSFHLRVE
jgi:hypothetical protein